MKSGGIENPAFESPCCGLDQRSHAASARPGAGAVDPGACEPYTEEGPCGWGPCTPRVLQFCNNAKGYLATYSLLAIFQGKLWLLPGAHAVCRPGAAVVILWVVGEQRKSSSNAVAEGTTMVSLGEESARDGEVAQYYSLYFVLFLLFSLPKYFIDRY